MLTASLLLAYIRHNLTAHNQYRPIQHITAIILQVICQVYTLRGCILGNNRLCCERERIKKEYIRKKKREKNGLDLLPKIGRLKAALDGL